MSAMITPAEIEAFAQQIADPGFNTADIVPLIGHLNKGEFEAVVNRATDLANAAAAAAQAEADALVALSRLADAAGCPKGTAVVPWLLERGLIEEVAGGWRFKRAAPQSIASARGAA